MTKKIMQLLKKLFHKKHKFISNISYGYVRGIVCHDKGSDLYCKKIRNEILTCKICGYTEIKQNYIE